MTYKKKYQNASCAVSVKLCGYIVKAEKFPDLVWEPACGNGMMSEVLKKIQQNYVKRFDR